MRFVLEVSWWYGARVYPKDLALGLTLLLLKEKASTTIKEKYLFAHGAYDTWFFMEMPSALKLGFWVMDDATPFGG